MNSTTLRAFLVLFLLPVAARAQREATVPDPDPELERKALVVADGFEVTLFAADPLLAKPIQMNFDPAGRLWVACSESYPQIKPGQKANDKVLILEDTKGTGKADKVTVFADGLLIPTGIAPGNGGVYVANSTDLLHLSDAHGSGKADTRRVVLSGFGTEDTHHMLHTLRWGPDGRLYMNQSIYIHTHLETPHGPRRLLGGGIWAFRTETLDPEVFARGWVNAWGHHFDYWGQSFVTDGAGGEGINYVIPGGYYQLAVGAVREVPGLNPGSPKYCGEEIVSGRHLPDDWQGNIITNDFRGHRVCRFVLKEDGAGYAAREMGELVKTTHPAFRPIDVKMGPDGAIYIADWYNPIIQHGEVDFRDPRRDVTHGRIWRVTVKGRPLVERPKLVGAATPALLDALKSPEGWTREQAKRLLQERGVQIVPELAQWVVQLDPADREHEHQLLEALWTYESLDVVEPKLLATVLHAKDYRARAAAVRAIQLWHDRLPNALELLATAVADEEPRVRLEAARALARIKQPRSVELALLALDRPVDRFLDYALWLTARELEPVWAPALQAGQLDFGGNVRHLLFALQAANSRDMAKPLLELVRGGKVPREREEAILSLLAMVGGPNELRFLIDQVVSSDTAAARQAAILAALEQVARQRQIKPGGDLGCLKAPLASSNEAVRSHAARLAGLWQVEAVRPRLVELATDSGSAWSVRRAAFEGLELLGGAASKETLTELAGPGQTRDVRRGAVIALAGLDPVAAARLAVLVLAEEKSPPDAAPVFVVFLDRKNGINALADALGEHRLPPDVARVGVRTIRDSGREAPALLEALTKSGALTFGPKTLTAEEMRRTLADVTRKGDPARGETLFRRADLSCMKCHAIAGAGGQVGPDLASVGASAPVDYLVESILEPNKAVKENYHSLTVTTKKGRIFTGIKVSEDKDKLVLRTADDSEASIPIKSIEERTIGGSLMPAGLADTLTHAEFVDLVRFLSELGRLGPYSVSKARLVRRWQVLQAAPAGAALEDASLPWGPAYSLVSGTLPLEALPVLERDSARISLVRCQLDVSTAGKVKLRLNQSSGLTLWVDRARVEAKDEVVLDLPAGLHVLTWQVDRKQRTEGLRCELDDEPGSPARARIVGGK